MPTATSWKCDICHKKFTGPDAHERAQACEAKGQPRYKYKVGQVFVHPDSTPGLWSRKEIVGLTATRSHNPSYFIITDVDSKARKQRESSLEDAIRLLSLVLEEE